MPEEPWILTRRSALLLAFGAPLFASGEFWEKKQPSDWTSEEIDKLITKSPWAKEVTATLTRGEGDNSTGRGGGGGYPGGGYPGGGYPGGGYPGGPRIGIPGIGIGMPRRGTGGNRMPRQGQATTYRGTVRWESAKPILEVMKTPLPAAFANHYVISVSGIPLLGRGRSEDDENDSKDNRFDELKQFTTLQAKGKDLVQAGMVQRQVSNGSSILFGFSRDLDLSKDDKEVLFSTQLGNLAVKAKFEPKEMQYHGALSV